MISRRKFIIGMSIGLSTVLLPGQSYALVWLGTFGKILGSVVKVAGYASRGSRHATSGMRASNYYQKVRTPTYRNIAAISYTDRRIKLSDHEKNYINKGVREGANEHLAYLLPRDKQTVIENTERLVNAAQNIGDIGALADYCAKYDNPQGVVYFAARAELRHNLKLKTQIDQLVANTNLIFAKLNRDLEYEEQRQSRIL